MVLIVRKQQKSAGDNKSALILKLMGSHPESETEGTGGSIKLT